jgi:CRP-like cAMP-binding protein
VDHTRAHTQSLSPLSANEILGRAPRLGPGTGRLRRRAHRAGQILFRPDDATDALGFPLSGVIALVRETSAGASIGVSLVGREGCLGLGSWMGLPAQPFSVMSVISGEAVWVGAAELRKASPPRVDAALQRYAAAQLIETRMAAVCNRLHPVEQRTAKLLLEIADRARIEEVEVTHEVLGNLLGEQRPHVTIALARLEHAAAIHRGRGRILIRDMARLRDCSCECYDVAQTYRLGAVDLPAGRDTRRVTVLRGQLDPAAVP